MTKVSQVTLLCDLIDRSVAEGTLTPQQLTSLFELVREKPYQHEQALMQLSTAAKLKFRLYCCLRSQFHSDQLHGRFNPPDQLLKSAIRLIEIGTLLTILGENHEQSNS